jgi:hypothetical protein
MGAEGAVEEISGSEAADSSAASSGAAPAAAEPSATSADESASKRAKRALELAGRALDSKARGGPDLELARVLLRRAMLWSAKAVTPAEPVPGTVTEAWDRLERAGGIGQLGERSDGARAELEALETTPASSEIQKLERLVADIVRGAAEIDRMTRARKVRRFGVIGLLAATALSILLFTYLRFPSDSYAFVASSAHKGFYTEGRLGSVYAYGLVLHTRQEREPWVEIDLQKTRTVKGLTLRNRPDCCSERGIPMIVELAGEDKAWRVVAERNKPFDTWVVKFPPQEARWARIRSTATTVLHFREIKVR